MRKKHLLISFFYGLLTATVITHLFTLSNCSKIKSSKKEIPQYYLKIENNKLLGWNDEIIKNPQLLQNYDTLLIGNNIYEIDPNAFIKDKGLISTIPDNIKTLKFADDSKIETIKKRTFHNCPFINVYFPKSLKILEHAAFGISKNLTNVIFPKDAKIETFGDRCFVHCEKLEKINFPDSLQSIGIEAFSKCVKLNKINLPSSLINLKKGAFNTCRSLSIINFDNNNKIEIFEERVFAECEKLKNIKFPQSLKKICKYAFEWCVNLEEIDLPISLKEVENNAFSYCSKLNKVIFKENLKSIGKQTFSCCKHLSSIYLPIDTKIYSQAFNRCVDINSINFLINSNENNFDSLNLAENSNDIFSFKKRRQYLDKVKIFKLNKENRYEDCTNSNQYKNTRDNINNSIVLANKPLNDNAYKKSKSEQNKKTNNKLNYEDKINKLEEIINNSSDIVFFGGAGVSTESNIPDFRSPNGIYNKKWKYDNIKPASICLSKYFLEEYPEIYYDWRYTLLVNSNVEIKPNLAHYKMAIWEDMGKVTNIITQNIDRLHTKAGSKNCCELHGTMYECKCMKCGKEYSFEEMKKLWEKDKEINKERYASYAKCSDCKGTIRPKTVAFGERTNDETLLKAIDAIENCETLIVAGTSLSVYPACELINYFKGNNLVLINQQDTDIDTKADLIITEKPVGETLNKIIINKEKEFLENEDNKNKYKEYFALLEKRNKSV